MPSRRNFIKNQKAREWRRRVVLPARMRTDSGWCDVSILNLSSRGLMVHTRLAAAKGSTVELCQGEHMITARVVWSKGPRVGLAAEALLPIEQILTPGRSAPLQMPESNGRRTDRFTNSHDRSRDRSRMMEFVSAI